MPADSMREAFGRVIADGVHEILKRQRSDGCIEFVSEAPSVFAQQAIFPLAYCWAGLDGTGAHVRRDEVLAAIRALGRYLAAKFKDNGEIEWQSGGNTICSVDQRLILAWIEALRILREQNADIDFGPWEDRIFRACDRLIDHSLKKLQNLRRFIVRTMGTGTNHVALYIAAVFRAAQVFRRSDYESFILPIARAFAADIHPDGYWEEHGDISRTGGPTPVYNYLSHCGIALMYEWTGEAVFLNAIQRSTRFFGNFTYPNGEYCDLFDERVRHGHPPGQWGLFGFSHWPEGRSMAVLKFKHWLKHDKRVGHNYPEILARHCENQMYWHAGPLLPAAFEQEDHTARLQLPAAIVRRGKWCVALSAISAANAEDAAYRDNPFALERQKLFSVFHEDAGLVIDGSHSKFQPDNSTFAASGVFPDYLPCGGEIKWDQEILRAAAAYKSYFGEVAIRMLDDANLEISFCVDPGACPDPIVAAFTMTNRNQTHFSVGETALPLSDEAVARTVDESGFIEIGNVKVSIFQKSTINWPLMPFNSYAANRKSQLSAAMLRICSSLTAHQPHARFLLTIGTSHKQRRHP